MTLTSGVNTAALPAEPAAWSATKRMAGVPLCRCAEWRAHRLLRLLPVPARHRPRMVTGHPVICSFEPGETWFWSYPGEDFYDSGPELAGPVCHPVGQPAPGPADGSRTTGALKSTRERYLARLHRPQAARRAPAAARVSTEGRSSGSCRPAPPRS